jgi:fibronectin-binding autotransporter adhesin
MSILNWIGGHSANFLDKLNWSPQQTPNSTSDCLVNPTSPTAISVANATINSLATDANVTLSVVNTDTFTILGVPDAANSTGVSTNSGTILLGSACDLFLDGGGFDNIGTLKTAGGSDVWVNSTLENDHTVSQSGDFTLGQSHVGTVINDTGAVWSIQGAHDIVAGAAAGSTSTFTNMGTLTRGGAGVSDFGVAMTNSGRVTVNGGLLEFTSTVTNTDVMTATGGATLQLDKAASGTGALDIGTGAGTSGTLNLVTGADTNQTVKYLGTGTLDLEHAGAFAGHISGFGGSDLVDLVSTLANGFSYSGGSSGGVLTLTENGTAIAHLNMIGSYTKSTFSLGSDGHSGTLIHFV